MSPNSTPRVATGVVMAITGMLSVQYGAALATRKFDDVGAPGMVFLRLAFAAVILLVVARPAVAGRPRRDLLMVAGFGVVLAGMNLSFYEALARLPLGVAVTVELLGPLGLALSLSRSKREVGWACLAVLGVVLLGGGGSELDLVGVAFALLAAVGWAAYILLSEQAGARFSRLEGLALATTVAAFAAAPVGIATAGATLLESDTLRVGLAVALLSSVVAYSLDLMALRRLSARVFGVLMSLNPVVAGLIGVIVLGQVLTPLETIAVACVVTASAGTVWAARTRPARRAPEVTLGP